MILNVNREYKSSVFSTLFGTPDALRELYSAIEGVDIPPDAIININTLSDAIFMEQINDLSFTIDDRIVVLVEHQSSICENVPVRLLMYISRIYEKIIDCRKLYQRKLTKIPAPEFIILYNGKDPYPDHKELRLSAAFKDTEGLKISENDFPLELVVNVYNINHGRNPEILAKSKTLDSYSKLIEKIREYNKEKTLEESVKDAIKYCIGNDILEQFLKNHASEVLSMFLFGWNLEEVKEVWREEAHEEGWEEGHAKGHAVGHAQGHAQGRVQEKIEIAQNLLYKGSSPEFIHEITGLSFDEIEKLK